MLAGFDEPTSGRILLDGQDLRGIPPYRRPVNMMFQSYALFPHMTVEANIAFGLKQEGMPKAEIDARVEEMLQAGQAASSSPSASRTSFPAASASAWRSPARVAKRPKVLLLDEPLGALDKKLREETQFELMDLQQSLGLTFVVVTHDQEEAMTMADRIAILDKGQVMQVATPAEIYEAPASRFVADFVGNVNMFEGTVAAREANTARITGASGAEIVVENAGDAAAGNAVAFAVRPEKIKVSSRRPEGARQRHGRRGLRPCLSRRHDRLSRQASGRAGGEGERAEQLAPDRRSADLERPRLDFLPAGCRRRADAIGAAMTDAAVSIAAAEAPSSRRSLGLLARRPGGDRPPRHHRSLSLAAVLLPHPLRHRLQDIAVEDGDRHAALYAGLQLRRGSCGGSGRSLASSTSTTISG